MVVVGVVCYLGENLSVVLVDVTCYLDESLVWSWLM